MDYVLLLGASGWILALIQFVLGYRESRRKNEEDLLEKTLGYFERGTLARSAGISLVEAIWYPKKKHLEVIVPVLISQLGFLLTEAEDFAYERRNLIRMLFLLEKSIPYSVDPYRDSIEILEILMSAGSSPPKIPFEKETLRHWFLKFNDGDAEQFDIETEP